jgi:hypothetical protein
MALHELQHRLAGQRQASLVAGPAHGLADAGGRQLRDHARALGRRQAGAVGQDAGVGHQQFLADLGSRPSMIQLKRTWASTARMTSGSCTSPMR